MLGPESLHWRFAGDNRVMLLQVKAAVLQLMHPGLGAGVQFHSRFYGQSFEGITASVPAIQGMTYDWPDLGRTAAAIKSRHGAIRGVDDVGRRYSALAPETYFWGHATMFDMMAEAIDLFVQPLGRDDKDRLYLESLATYELYGVSTRDVPKNWTAFREYFDHVCTDRLEMTPAAAALLKAQNSPPTEVPGIPAPVYRLVRKSLGTTMWWLGLGRLHPAVRDRIGFEWTRRDDARLRALSGVVRSTWPLLPERARYSREYREARSRLSRR